MHITGNQNPRWTQNRVSPYVYAPYLVLITVLPRNDAYYGYSEPTMDPKTKYISMFTQHSWFLLLCSPAIPARRVYRWSQCCIAQARFQQQKHYLVFGRIGKTNFFQTPVGGVGTVLPFDKAAWSTVKLLRQATNEHSPPPPAPACAVSSKPRFTLPVLLTHYPPPLIKYIKKQVDPGVQGRAVAPYRRDDP